MPRGIARGFGMPHEQSFFVCRMLNLTGDETIRIAQECPQTCTGAKIHDLSAI